MEQKPTYEDLEKRVRDLESCQAETQQLEQAYLEQERLLEIIINELPFWFSLKDSKGRYLLVNNNLAEAHGLKASEFLNRTTLETPELYPHGLKSMVERDKHVLQTGQRVDVPEYRVGIGEDTRWRRLVKVPWINERGEILGVVSWSEDITESKRVREELHRHRDHLEELVEKRTEELQLEILSHQQTEAALTKSEKHLKEIIELSDAGYFFIGLDGCFQKVNKAWLRLHQYETAKEIIGKHFSITQPTEDSREAQNTLDKLLSGRKIRTGEFSRRCKDGSTGYHSFTARPVEKNGAIVGVEGFLIDITEHKRLEKQILRSKKMEAIGTLSGGIAHEFNNLIGIILGNAELAIDEIPAWNPAYKYTEEILTASYRAKNVVQKLLTVSLNESIIKQPIQVSTIFEETTDLLSKTIPATINLHSNNTCTNELILANPSEINQLLINLCNNSVYAMREKSGLLQVNLESVELDHDYAARHENLQSGRYLRLTVADTGEGIESSEIERVFDPYFTTKDVDEGLGMGLAVASGIVTKHNGAISIESAKGKGTTVEILLPLHQPQRIEKAKNPLNRLPDSCERILLVDDEQSLIKMIQRMLERQGYDVVGKTSSLEALDSFKKNPERFDLVITDMTMPDMAGDTLAQEIRRIRPDIPIVLCTGYSESLDDTQVKELNITALMYKPILQKDLLRTVRTVMDCSR